MGALAALFVEAGHEVSGSDVAFDPPIGPALRAMNVRCLEGYEAAQTLAHELADGLGPVIT